MTPAPLPLKSPVETPDPSPRKVVLGDGPVVEIETRNGTITLQPDIPLTDLRGFLRGMDTGGLREKKDRY